MDLSQRQGFLDPIFAKYYEQSDNTRQTDIPFYVAQGLAAGGVVLDAGCGSGRILIPMLEAGVSVEGFDSSPVMLEALSKKLSVKSLNAKVWQDHLESFEAPRKDYSLIVCTFNTFLHLMDHESQNALLRRFHDSLATGGKLVMDLTSPTNFEVFSRKALGKTFEATLYDGATDTQTTIWRWFERDLIMQRGIYHRQYETEGADGRSQHATQIAFRWTYPEEMKLLLDAAGFSKCSVEGDFKGEALNEDHEMQVWTAWK